LYVVQAVIAHAEDLLCCPQPRPTKSKNCARGLMLPHGCALKAWPHGRIMATAAPQRPVATQRRRAYVGGVLRHSLAREMPVLSDRSLGTTGFTSAPMNVALHSSGPVMAPPKL